MLEDRKPRLALALMLREARAALWAAAAAQPGHNRWQPDAALVGPPLGPWATEMLLALPLPPPAADALLPLSYPCLRALWGAVNYLGGFGPPVHPPPAAPGGGVPSPLLADLRAGRRTMAAWHLAELVAVRGQAGSDKQQASHFFPPSLTPPPGPLPHPGNESRGNHLQNVHFGGDPGRPETIHRVPAGAPLYSPYINTT